VQFQKPVNSNIQNVIFTWLIVTLFIEE